LAKAGAALNGGAVKPAGDAAAPRIDPPTAAAIRVAVTQ
jgi:hypothetical protein